MAVLDSIAHMKVTGRRRKEEGLASSFEPAVSTFGKSRTYNCNEEKKRTREKEKSTSVESFRFLVS